ncbi:MAG: hypothetical protein ACOYKE_02560 [Ferruginibacter sp.]
MFAVESYSTFDSSLSNAKTVVGLEWLYEGVKNHLGKIALLCFVLVVGLPVVFLLGYWLHTKRKQLQREMKKDLPLFKNHVEYLKFKENLSKLDSLLPALKKISAYNLKKAPWPIRYTLSQMQKLASSITTYNKWLKKHLTSYNEDSSTGKSKVFRLVSENELWKERNPVYNYWM